MKTLSDFFKMKGEAVYSVLRTISTILLTISIISVFASIVGMAVARGNEKIFVNIWFWGSLFSCVGDLFLFGFCYIIYTLKNLEQKWRKENSL